MFARYETGITVAVMNRLFGVAFVSAAAATLFVDAMVEGFDTLPWVLFLVPGVPLLVLGLFPGRTTQQWRSAQYWALSLILLSFLVAVPFAARGVAAYVLQITDGVWRMHLLGEPEIVGFGVAALSIGYLAAGFRWLRGRRSEAV